MKTKLPNDVLVALEQAKRGPGWNNRKPEVRCFDLESRWGEEPCRLLVVPAVAFTRNAERRRDERTHGRCLWWDDWAAQTGWGKRDAR